MAQPMYARIADELTALVRSGQLKAGDRLPSVRRLIEQKGVSASTAVAALRAVEHRGLAVARPQSGYFARPLRVQIAAPVTSRPRAKAHAVGIDSVMVQVLDASRDPAVAPLGAAQPDPGLFPANKLNRMVASVARRMPTMLAEYGLSYPGIESLRHQLLRRYADIGCRIQPHEVIATNGCTEALNLALRTVTRPGDTVAIESPVYYCILQVLQNLGLKALEIACHPAEGLQVDSLAAALKGRHGLAIKACLVSTNFSNPTGAIMSDGEKCRLVRLCSEHRVPLIEDDIYGDLQHAGSRPLPAKAFDEDGGVILCSSFSKTLAPGARVGWLCGGRYSTALGLAKFASSGASPAILQQVMAEMLASGGYERHLAKLRETYARQVAQMAAAVSKHFTPGTRITQPRGGFVIWVELPRGLDSLELFEAALEEGVNFAPGPLFSASGRYRNFLRLNCGRQWTRAIERAVERLGTLASRCLR